MKREPVKAKCDPCEWETDFLQIEEAEREQIRHDREHHHGDRTAVLVADSGATIG